VNEGRNVAQTNERKDTTMGFAEDMAELEQEWKDAPTDRPGGTGGPMLPDGQHQAMIVEANVEQRQSDEHWQLFMKFQNRQGVVRKWSDLDHEVGLRVAKADVALLGYEGNLAGLEAACKSFIGLVCNIAVKTKPGTERDFTNVYINACVGQAANRETFDIDPEVMAAYADQQHQDGASGDFKAAESEDDIPF
jgi:hypothetical protein